MRKYLGYTEKELIEWDKNEVPKLEEICKELHGEELVMYKREYAKKMVAFIEMCDDQTIDIVQKEQF